MKSCANAKGQIVIPALLRQKFGIKAGTRIQIQADEKTQSIILTPITREFVRRLCA